MGRNFLKYKTKLIKQKQHNMEMRAESILALFAGCDAQQRASFVSQVIDGLDSGYSDPIKTMSAIKNLQAILSDIEIFCKEVVIGELEKHGGKLELYGASFQKKEAGTKYDYSQTNDHIHKHLTSALENSKKAVKEREDFLKSLPADGQQVVDEDTGDVFKIYRPIKSSTTNIAVTLK
jgi:hypothetical protein